MTDWTTRFAKPAAVSALNRRLGRAMMHCPALTDAGWNFRCVECHIATGTYPTGHTSIWHQHEEYQIETILSGTFQFRAEGCRPVTMRSGQALVIPWRLPHGWKCTRRGVMVGISLELTPTLAATRCDAALFRKLHWLTAHPIRTKLLDLIHAAALDEQVPFSSMSTACQLFLFLSEVMRRVLPTDDKARSEPEQASPQEHLSEARGGELVGRIMRRISDNPALPLTLRQVAQDAGLSGRQVHRLFTQHTGKSLHEWLLEQRLELARDMLVEQGRSIQIKEVAFQCGFSSATYFTSLFRKFYGFAPTAQITGDGVMKSRVSVISLPAPDQKQKPPSESAQPRRPRVAN